MRFLLTLCLVAVAPLILANPAVIPIHNLPVDGGRDITAPSVRATRLSNNLDEIYDAGTTWYDYQHNGTAGKMIGVDELGFVHMVWMNGLDAASVSRHVYYNVWDPATQTFLFQDGQQINNSLRAGYVCLTAKNDGFCFPAWHNKTEAAQVFGHAASAIDFLPTTGAFTTTEPDWLNIGGGDIEACWPKIAMDIVGNLHMVSTENPSSGTAGTPQRIYYSRGTPVFDGGFGSDIEWQAVEGDQEFMLIDTVMVIAPNIACSRATNRVVITWSKSRDDLSATPSQYNNDLYMMISEDGGENWGDEINITNFEYPDFDCASGDTLFCDKDTFRVYTDMSVILDNNDNIHIAFTTCYLYEIEGLINIVYSDIWHWDESRQVYSNIAHGYFNTDSAGWVNPGAWQRVVQRPSLAIDTTTGYLYCSFQRYDSLQWSESGWPQGDAYITVSTNNGFSWAEATNVTNTDGGQNAPAGECLSERDITLADYVTYNDAQEGFLHMLYVLDLDAGGIPQNEGIATLNPVQYQRISLDDIATTPIHDPGYPALRVDSTGYPFPLSVHEGIIEHPQDFSLHQNYPNPFNPATHIQFDLTRNSAVELSVYNITGQIVTTVLKQSLAAGTHIVEFDGSGLSSGVYLYRLSVNGQSVARKMLLAK